jgi:hypothetical protein
MLKLLDAYQWIYTECEKILKLLEKTINEKMTHLLEMIKYFIDNFVFLIEVIDLFSDIDVKSFLDLLESRNDVIRLIEIRRFLTMTEKKYMCELIAELSMVVYFEVCMYFYVYEYILLLSLYIHIYIHTHIYIYI